MEYQISCLDPAMHELRRIGRRASELGILDAILGAYKTLDRRLKQDPRVFGDRYGRFAHAKLDLYIGVAAPIVAHYGVHDEEQRVIVQAVKVLSGWGLEEDV